MSNETDDPIIPRSDRDSGIWQDRDENVWGKRMPTVKPSQPTIWSPIVLKDPDEEDNQRKRTNDDTLRQIAVVFGSIYILLYGMMAWNSLSSKAATQMEVSGGLVWAMMAVTAAGFVAGGALLTAKPEFAKWALQRCAVLGVTLTLASILPLYVGTMQILIDEENGKIPGEHLLGFVNDVAFWAGIGIDLLQVMYCVFVIAHFARNSKRPD